MNILLLGLGNVGMKYDIGAPEDQVLTHLKAITNWGIKMKKNCKIIGIDTNPRTRSTFYDLAPNGHWYENIDDVSPDIKIDLSIIAAPINYISALTIKLFELLRPSCLVVEKPAASSTIEIKSLHSIRDLNSNAIVGFPRTFLDSSDHLKRLFDNFDHKQNWQIEINYGGSVLNILSHFINLVEYFLGTFDYQSHFHDKDGYLHASFQSHDKLITINTNQYSKFNDEKCQIIFKGPVLVKYKESGRKIEIYKTTNNLKPANQVMDCRNEISQMIGTFAENYLNWFQTGVIKRSTKLDSNALFQTIKLSEVSGE
jgi:predicted dehydrogenase